MFGSPMQITPMIRLLIGFNIIVYFTVTAMIPEEIRDMWFVVHYPTSDYFQPIQLLTNMFMHSSGSHLFFNMLGLYMFGTRLEAHWGQRQFLFYYLFCGFAALILEFGVRFYQINFTNISTIEIEMIKNGGILGASGAIFGVLAGYGYYFRRERVMMIFPPIETTAGNLVIFYILIEVYQVLSRAETGVAHLVHLSGALFGYLIIKYWQKGGQIGKH